MGSPVAFARTKLPKWLVLAVFSVLGAEACVLWGSDVNCEQSLTDRTAHAAGLLLLLLLLRRSTKTLVSRRSSSSPRLLRRSNKTRPSASFEASCISLC